MTCKDCIHNDMCYLIEHYGADEYKACVCKDFKNKADFVEQKWIAVNDRLPDTDGRYIVCTKNITGWKPLNHNVFISDYMFNDFIYDGWENNLVTHWMPLPEPPKGASNETD